MDFTTFFTTYRRALLWGLAGLLALVLVAGSFSSVRTYFQQRHLRQQAAAATVLRNQQAAADRRRQRQADSVYFELLGQGQTQQLALDSARRAYESLLRRRPARPF